MFAIAPTDLDWFASLRSEPVGRSVNFWTPTPWGLRGLGVGERLYFMLKSPIRKIGGHGSFVRYLDMTASEAWSTFGLGNGVESKDALVQKITAFAEKRAKGYVASSDPIIGCIELSDVVTLDDDSFLDPEEAGHPFPRQIVKLKYFSEPDQLALQLGRATNRTASFALVEGDPNHKLARRKERKGQSLFRQDVLRNYGYRCCVLGEGIVELLEAAHIQPFINERSNHAQNGVCLRVDLHRLFDEGLLMITDDHRLRVSSKLDDTSYAALDGRKVSLPADRNAWPAPDALAAHRRSFR